jgi:gluconokinase
MTLVECSSGGVGRVVILIGPAGAGKTTIGQRLAQELRWAFVDADSFHSLANIEKLAKGEPLADEDRGPWLESLRQAIEGWLSTQRCVVLACSALKRRYREALHVSPDVYFVYLRAHSDVLRQRLEERRGHIARVGILSSQLADLEEPGPDEALVIDANQEPERVIEAVRRGLPGL